MRSLVQFSPYQYQYQYQCKSKLELPTSDPFPSQIEVSVVTAENYRVGGWIVALRRLNG
jgi:hypothetical protein